MNINLCFPTAIGISECPFIDEIQDKYKKILEKADFQPTGFCNSIRPFQYKKFNKLNKWILEEVNKYIKAHNYKDEYECKDSWAIDYRLGLGQPFHKHPGFIISALFFLEGYEQDVRINFLNPIDDMMNPLNDKSGINIETNELTHQILSFPPKHGRLIIWRSYLMHGVSSKVEKCKRIIFSYNFNRK